MLHCSARVNLNKLTIVSVINLFNMNYDTTTGKATEPFQSIFESDDKGVVFGCQNCFAYAGVSFKFRCYWVQCLRFFWEEGWGRGGRWGMGVLSGSKYCNITSTSGAPCTSAHQVCISSISNWNSKANSSRISILLPLPQPLNQALK